ncbi:unnamed protein product [Vitrella brassicaformis CCMP3155]|uniref:Uncharacterized protein n=2 Tax=Vitrella brassicaformis TaxID=1169539 RepID=A0A0G4GTD6_VITBC|nr:unnamed protein product [Vitrella brassicaformis CCMP3155]|eukprot:CEM33750.1 unnamed protein product [Vitrella brassicaformis CCMP3155]
MRAEGRSLVPVTAPPDQRNMGGGEQQLAPSSPPPDTSSTHSGATDPLASFPWDPAEMEYLSLDDTGATYPYGLRWRVLIPSLVLICVGCVMFVKATVDQHYADTFHNWNVYGIPIPHAFLFPFLAVVSVVVFAMAMAHLYYKVVLRPTLVLRPTFVCVPSLRCFLRVRVRVVHFNTVISMTRLRRRGTSCLGLSQRIEVAYRKPSTSVHSPSTSSNILSHIGGLTSGLVAPDSSESSVRDRVMIDSLQLPSDKDFDDVWSFLLSQANPQREESRLTASDP